MWPQHILRKSDRLLDTKNIENKFYPLYDDILNECFPRNRFSICPQYATPMAQSGGVGAIDFTITYVVEALDLESIVFILEIKPPTHLPVLSARKDADNEICKRFGEISHLIRIPKLYAISAIGRHLAYYTYEIATGLVEPPRIDDSVSVVRDTVIESNNMEI